MISLGTRSGCMRAEATYGTFDNVASDSACQYNPCVHSVSNNAAIARPHGSEACNCSRTGDANAFRMTKHWRTSEQLDCQSDLIF